jgi:hypothetical protein
MLDSNRARRRCAIEAAQLGSLGWKPGRTTRYAPDLVLAPGTDLDTLRNRKVDLSVEEHTPKAEVVQALEPGPGMVVIDSDKPYVEIPAEAQASVWRALIGGR